MKKLEDFKYKTSFAYTVVCVTDEEVQKTVSKASLEELKGIIPEDVKKEDDLLPIAFNSCVPNLGNGNGDMIDSKTALAIYKSFIHKPINIEHERVVPIGHIVGASFSEFNEDYKNGKGSKIIEASNIKDKKEPFNLSLSAVLYRLYNTKVVEEIEESSKPNSSKYLAYSASWELAFDEYVLAVGSKYLKDCEIIEAEDKIEEMKKYLLDEGGTGKTPDGKPIYRLIKGEIIPLGIGITENPAADVAGITSDEEVETIKASKNDIEILSKLTDISEKQAKATIEAVLFGFEELLNKSQKILSINDLLKLSGNKENNSQFKKDTVKANNNNVKQQETIMIKSRKDITDELLKKEETKASHIMEFIDSEVNRISDEYKEKRDEYKNKLTEAEQSQEELKEKFSNAEKELERVKKQLKDISDANEAREEQETFNARMTYFEGEYKLDDRTRNIVAKRIKGLTEEDYKSEKEELETLLASFKVIKHDESNSDCKCDSCVAKASAKTKESTASAKTKEEVEEDVDVDGALKNAKQVNGGAPNTTTTDETLAERAAKAFGKDNWEIKKRR